MTKMRHFALLVCLSSSLLFSPGCGGGGGGGQGGSSGGAGGTAGSGAIGGQGGIGGAGGAVRMCINPRDCSDGQACTVDLCRDRVCAYEPVPDYTVCGSDTGVSACLGGECQLIWATCGEQEAEDGDFCRPTPEPDPPRLGRCDSGVCVVSPCTIGFDCWSGEACKIGLCDESTGTCSVDNAPDGNACIPPAGGRCFEGVCGGGAGGTGGQGGAAGQSGAGGQGGA